MKALLIFHETPEGWAWQMAAVWQAVPSSWHRDKARAVRLGFCVLSGCISEKLLDVMSMLFLAIAGS